MIRDGFIRVAASTPEVKVADVEYNREQVCEQIEEGRKKGASIMVFPELVLTGYTCGELFIQKSLLAKAREELRKLIAFTSGDTMLVFVGLPWEYNNKLYNVAAAIQDGKLLGLVPKRWIPNYSEFYEGRYFNPGWEKTIDVSWDGYQVPMGMKLLFSCDNVENLVVGAEICEDVWVLNPPSIAHASAGATVIVNCSASDEVTGKSEYRRSLISGQSARLLCAYIYANAGEGESSQDLVFGGQNIIAENGNILSESARFENQTIYADIDLELRPHNCIWYPAFRFCSGLHHELCVFYNSFSEPPFLLSMCLNWHLNISVIFSLFPSAPCPCLHRMQVNTSGQYAHSSWISFLPIRMLYVPGFSMQRAFRFKPIRISFQKFPVIHYRHILQCCIQ